MNVPSRAEYFRRDGHPRPTVGEAMIGAMFPGTSAEGSGRLSSDFGTDLLALPQAGGPGLIARTQDRWSGQWAAAESCGDSRTSRRLDELRRRSPIGCAPDSAYPTTDRRWP